LTYEARQLSLLTTSYRVTHAMIFSFMERPLDIADEKLARYLVRGLYFVAAIAAIDILGDLDRVFG